MKDTPVIAFENVSYSYPGASKSALDGVSFCISSGEFLAIVGANGSGKSTLALHMDALLRPQSGKVLLTALDGAQLDTANKCDVFPIRKLCALVFQDPDDQTVASTVEEDVAFGPENLGLSREEIRERVDQALAQVGLEGFQERMVAELSRGQRQRVAVAGGLAMQPELLVCDEPTAMLDASGRRAVMDVLGKINQAGTAVALITHDMDEALQADRILVMDAGKIIIEGMPRQVFSRENALLIRKLGIELPAPAAYALDHDLPGELPLTLDELVQNVTERS